MHTKRLLDNHTQTLRPAARALGEKLARQLFAARGNKTEAHLNEYELALAIAAGAQVAIEIAKAIP